MALVQSRRHDLVLAEDLDSRDGRGVRSDACDACEDARAEDVFYAGPLVLGRSGELEHDRLVALGVRMDRLLGIRLERRTKFSEAAQELVEGLAAQSQALTHLDGDDVVPMCDAQQELVRADAAALVDRL